MTTKNIAEGSCRKLSLEEDCFILMANNESSNIQKVTHPIDRSFIQFHFCLKGGGKFIFNEGRYAMEITEDHSLLLYNTQTDLPLHLEFRPGAQLVSLVMTIRSFHALFSTEAGYIPFLSEENRSKKYYTQDPISPAVSVILNQLVNYNLHPSVSPLYLRGKIYELIALLFNRGDDTLLEQCPYLVDEDHLKRIRRAKEIIIERMSEPPGLKPLAEEVGLSLKKLKEGFKQVYGDSVYSFLFDYKMEYARKMLESQKFNVNEVGLKVGYSTASHFIAAFRKKFGTTPKKYVMSLAS
ncbi:AraC family transcriptional regulator [Flavobacteriaceae bacterium D16]|nr:AraC family transcriptional regulator [Flavobacteriaceae bacterium D16]